MECLWNENSVALYAPIMKNGIFIKWKWCCIICTYNEKRNSYEMKNEMKFLWNEIFMKWNLYEMKNEYVNDMKLNWKLNDMNWIQKCNLHEVISYM